MSTLYHGQPNTASLTVLAALEETGVQVNKVYMDLSNAERHSAGIPNSVETSMSVEGEGPILEVNGEAMADSVFITRYLESIGNGTKLSPKDSFNRWGVMTFCRQIIERLAPAASYLGTKAHLTSKLAAISDDNFNKMMDTIHSDDLKQRWIDIRNNNFSEEHIEDSKQKVSAAVERIEAQLGDSAEWLFGDFGIADLEAYAWLAGMVELVPEAFTSSTKTSAWLDRVKARPSVQAALATATVDNPQNSWAPGPEINRWG